MHARLINSFHSSRIVVCNKQKNIRWSTDFRLHPKKAQRPGKGGDLDWFYGLKDSLLVRDGTNPTFKPDVSTTTILNRRDLFALHT